MVKSGRTRGRSSSEAYAVVGEPVVPAWCDELRHLELLAVQEHMSRPVEPSAGKAPDMKIRVELDEKILRMLVIGYLEERLGSLSPKIDMIKIEVKSKQNYKSEWEEAEFRAVYEEVKRVPGT